MMKSIKKQEVTIQENASPEEETALRAESEALYNRTVDKEKVLQEDRDKVTDNAYELALHPFKNLDEFKLDDIFDVNLYAFLCYTMIIVLSVLLFRNSVLKKYKRILRQAIIILLLLAIPLIIFYIEKVLEDINQIKYGYYLFFINILAIIYFSRKAARNATV